MPSEAMANVKISEDRKPPMMGNRPVDKIYQDLFIMQDDNELTETFITKKRALFAELPPPNHLESQKLDMIYSSLREKIREKVPRDTVQTFEELLDAAKRAEESMKPKKRIRCNFCRHVGHTADECRKKADVNNGSSAPGERKFGGRLTIKFQIDDIWDEGILGTAAESCVASHKLYTQLKARGYRFTQCRDIVNSLGSREMDFLRVSCNIKLCGRIIPTTFVIFPEANEPDTYLGIPFLMHITFGPEYWYFNDNPTKTYPVTREKPRNDNIARIGLLTFG